MKNEIGAIVQLTENLEGVDNLKKFGLTTCQLVSWDPSLWSEKLARVYRLKTKQAGVHTTAFWAGWLGPRVWDLIKGPVTLGLVPSRYRAMRVQSMKRAGDFAVQLGVPAVITHLGFIPENCIDPLFSRLVKAVREVALYYKRRGLQFWFETGQETPVTMLRLIQAAGTGNLGLNLDPANLILYGKANPIDSLDVFGKYVRNIHAKDGMYPTDPMKLGHEVKVGTGRVRYPEFIKKLKQVGFKGEFIIEREISGKQQQKDIKATIQYLQRLLRKI